MNFARFVAVLASFAVVACNKSSESQPAAPKVEAKKEPCPAGYFTDPAGRFCAKLPAGYKIVQEKEGPGYPSVILNDDKDTDKVTIVLAPADQFDVQAGAMPKDVGTGDVITEQLDIADGKGKFMTVDGKDVGIMHTKGLVRTSKHTLICQAMWNDERSSPAPEICKSLRPQN